jgi:hypothetical protein
MWAHSGMDEQKTPQTLAIHTWGKKTHKGFPYGNFCHKN